MSNCTIATPVRKSQIEDQLIVFGAACDCLEKTISAIEDKLQSVATHATPGEPVTGHAVMELVPLADRLRDRNRHLELLVNRLRSLTDRIEL